MIKIYKKHKTIKHSSQADIQPRRLDFGWLGQAFLKRKIMLFSVIFLIVTLPIFFLVVKYQSKVEAAWYNDAWGYRKAISIPSHTTLETNVYVTIPTFDATDTSRFQSDCGDLRFTKQNGEQLPYYVVSCTSTAVVHVFFNSLPAGASTYYMYYGNPNVANGFSSADFSSAATGLGDQTLATEEKGGAPVGYWKFDEGQGATANNSVWKKTGTTTNLITNPSFENATNWWNYGQWSPETTNLYDDVTLTTDTNTRLFGASSGKVAITAVDGLSAQTYDIFYSGSAPAASAGQTWSGSQWIKVESNSGISNYTLYIVCRDSGGGWISYSYNTTTSATNWTNLRTNVTCGANTNNVVLYLYVNGIDNGDSVTFYTDGWQLENTSFSNLYCDGSILSNGSHIWNGTAHASSSTCDTGTDGSISATWATEDQCVNGKCLSLNGSNNNIYLGTSLSLRPTDAITVEMWFKMSPNNTNWANLIGNWQYVDGVNSTGYGIFQNSSSQQIIFAMGFVGQDDASIGGIPIITNQWQHAVMTYDKTEGYFRAYLNGLQVGTPQARTGNIDYNAVAEKFMIGANQGNGQNFQGFFDEVKVYNYARSAAQIKTDFASKGGGAVKGTSVQMGTNAKNNDAFSNGLTAYWKSDEASGNGTDSSQNSNTTTVSGSNNYGTGKFGNGLRSGIATTNININPSVETGKGSGWYCWANSGAGTCVQSSDAAAFGQYSLKSTMSVSGSLGHYAGLSPASPSTTYTVSGYVNVSSFGGSNFAIYMRETYPTGNGQCGSNLYTVSAITNGWVRFSGTCTTRADTTSLGISYYLNDTGQTVYVDGIQIEAGSTVTPYLDGSLGTGYSWSGTAHASTSTRTASTATNATLLNNTSGSLSFWFNSPSLDTTAQCPLGSSDGDTTGGLFFGLKSTGVYLNHNYASSQNVTPQYVATLSNNTWYHVVYTWDNVILKGNLYVNGALQQTVSYTQAITIGEYIQNLGTCTRTGYTTFNGTLDDIRDYNRVLSSAEVAKLYAWAPGPVGYWNFEEGTGTTVNDITGNFGTGTWYGTGNHWTQGKFGKSGQFNSTDNYVNVGSGSPLQLSKTGTVCLWFKSLTAFSGSIGAQKQLMTGGPRSFYFSASSSILYYFLSDNATGIGSNAGSWDTNWHHVCTTSDGTTLKMYIDGIQQTSTIALGTNNYFGNLSAVTIGNSSTSFTGNIDEVKIYNYARTPGQIIEDMNGGHPLGGSPIGSQIGYWKFDEGHDATANNSGSGGSAINGAISGAAWSNNGKFGKALGFDGVNDRINASTNSILNFDAAGQQTISLWFNTSSLRSSPAGSANRIFTKEGSNKGYIFTIFSDLKLGLENPNGWGSIRTTTALSTNQWYHAVVTYNNQTVSLYLNGVLQATSGTTGTFVSDSTSIVYIGGNADNYQLTGLIDEVKLYNTALTADEIKLDYNRGSAMVLGTLSDTSGLSGGSVASSSAGAAYCIPGDTAACNPPVGEWKMEEKTGTNVYDTSGNGHNSSSFNGTPAWTRGKIGSALDFEDTNNDWVVIPDHNDLDMATNDFTACLWINPETTGAQYDSPLDHREDAGTNLGYQFRWGASNEMQFITDYGASSVVSGGTALSTGTWYYFCAVVDRDGLQYIYQNGQLVDSDSVATYSGIDISHTDNLIIGSTGNTSNDFDGKIDDVRIYNYVRSPAQIAYDYNQGKPVGWWKMDECQGITANDSSGNGNSGTITIGATVPQSSAGTCTAVDTATAWYNGRVGKYNSSLSFDGIDDEVTTADSPSLDMGTMTVSAWIKTTNAGQQTIVERNNSTFYFTAGVTSGKLCMWINTVSGTWTCTLKTISDGSWHHVIGSWDGTNKSLYVDGRLDTTVVGAGGNIANAAVGLNIGVRKNAGVPQNYFNGQIDDVRIYNYALTPQQVKMVYNGGAAVQFAPVTGTP